MSSLLLAVPWNNSIGPQGATGPAGPQGEPTVGPQGPQGATVIGPQGFQGASNVGPPGPQGEPGIGPQGPQGATVTGTQGPQGGSVSGPQGPQGTTGAAGVALPQGSIEPSMVLQSPFLPWDFVDRGYRFTRSGYLVSLVVASSIRGPAIVPAPSVITLEFTASKSVFGTPVFLSGTSVGYCEAYINTEPVSLGAVTRYFDNAVTTGYRISIPLNSALPANTDVRIEFNMTWTVQ